MILGWLGVLPQFWLVRGSGWLGALPLGPRKGARSLDPPLRSNERRYKRPRWDASSGAFSLRCVALMITLLPMLKTSLMPNEVSSL